MKTYQRNKSNLFYKYLFSYIITLLIPLILIGILVYSYFIGVFQKEVVSNNLNTLNQAKAAIDSQLIQLKNTSDQIYLSQNLQPFSFAEDPFRGVIAVSELKKYSSTNAFFSEIILYYSGDNYLFSSSSTYPVSRFTEIYRFENWDNESFKKDINTIVTPIVRSVENVSVMNGATAIKKRYITFIYPLTYNFSAPERTCIMLVPETSFQSLLQNSLKEYNSNTLVLDQQNNIVVSFQNSAGLGNENLVKFLSNSNNIDSQTITIENRKYLFSYIKSSETQWKYITLTPVKNVLEKVNKIKLIFIFGLVVVILFGSVTIYLLMNMNYRPIANLKLYADKFYRESVSSSNELEMVRNTIDFLNSENSELHGELKGNSHAVKEYLLYRLIKGQIMSASDLNKRGESIDFKLTKSIFRVIIFYSKAFKNNSDAEAHCFPKLIENSLPEEIEGYVRDQTDQNYLVLVASYDLINTSVFDDLLMETYRKLKTKLRTSVTLGIGNEYADITLVPKSYMEALTAIDYRLIKGMDKLIYFNEIVFNQSMFDVSLNRAPEKLKLLIKQGNTDQVENFLVNIVSYMKQNNTSIFTAKMICFDIINTIVCTMDEINNEYCIARKEYPNVFLVSGFETIDELTEIVTRVSQDICNYLKVIKEKEDVTLIERMILYLQDNYDDCDFSIQQMADYFTMSPSYLSQYFKDQKEVTLIEYTTNLKIDKAKMLLSSSNIALKDIAIEVGYYNLTSFIRRFKQLVGVTPGEYRKQMSNSSLFR